MLALEEDSIAAHLICMQALPNPPYSVRLVVSSYKASVHALAAAQKQMYVDVVPWISQQLLMSNIQCVLCTCTSFFH